MFESALRDEQIIRSPMDTDFYKFTMGQVINDKFRQVLVRFVFKNRTKMIRLTDTVSFSEVKEQLDAVRKLRFTNSELHFLRGTNEYQERMFAEPYLDFLRQYTFPEYELTDPGDGTIGLEFPGLWSEATYWETLTLSIIAELNTRAQLRQMSRFERDALFAQGIKQLREKIRLLRQYPEIMFTDFGARRRFSFLWQLYVLEILMEELPKQMIGTSNTYLAMKLGLVPMGTSAHEMYMGMYGIMHGSDEEILSSHNQVLIDWWAQYGYGLSIALTDTYGSDAFFRLMTPEMAANWKGLRHDSGDPFEFGEKAIKFYQSHGIDPREKLIVYSDGLDVYTIIKLWLRFNGRIKVTFGWGTNLTNDLGLPTLSLIVKLLVSCGIPTVKLSDNLAKAMGSPEEIERAKRIFGYTNVASQVCVY